jgi:hypothetical protein
MLPTGAPAPPALAYIGYSHVRTTPIFVSKRLPFTHSHPRVSAVGPNPKYALDGVAAFALTMASPVDLHFFIEVHQA